MLSAPKRSVSCDTSLIFLTVPLLITCKNLLVWHIWPLFASSATPLNSYKVMPFQDQLSTEEMDILLVPAYSFDSLKTKNTGVALFHGNFRTLTLLTTIKHG